MLDWVTNGEDVRKRFFLIPFSSLAHEVENARHFSAEHVRKTLNIILYDIGAKMQYSVMPMHGRYCPRDGL